MAVAGLWRMVSVEADRFRHAMEAEEFTLRYLPQVALAQAVRIDPRGGGAIPSTKGDQ